MRDPGGVRMQKLHELFSKYREQAGMTRKEVARALKVSYSYYTRLERPLWEGRAIPSDDFLRNFAKVVSKGDRDLEEKVKRELLLAKTAMKFPKELLYSTPREVEDFSNPMPDEFIERLRQDVDYVGLSKTSRLSDIPANVIELVLAGKYTLSRPAVIRLALALEQPPEEYLILAGYMTDDLQKLVRYRKELQLFFRNAKDIPLEKVQSVMKLVNDIILISRHLEKPTEEPQGEQKDHQGSGQEPGQAQG